MWESLRETINNLLQRNHLRLIVTIYPHLLNQIQNLERGEDSPFLNINNIINLPLDLDQETKDNILTQCLQQLGKYFQYDIFYEQKSRFYLSFSS